MPAAIAIPAIIGGGASLASAAIGAHAAGSARKEQQQATNQALAVNKGIYEGQQKLTNPYVQAGYTSLANLMQDHWGQRAGVPQAGAPSYGGPDSQRYAMQNQPGLGDYSSAMSGGVQMRAPDGSVKAVPQQLVEKYRAKGAQVIN